MSDRGGKVVPLRQHAPPAIDSKTCSVCSVTKTLTAFPIRRLNKKTGREARCKDCRRIYFKAYRETHLEEARAATRRSRDKKRQYYRQWQSEYKKRNPDKIKAQVKRYRNTERGRLVNRVAGSRYRARLRAAGGDFGPSQWSALLARQRYRCYYCKKKFCDSRPAEMDHLTPVSAGGSHTESNIVAACKSCNCSKNAKRVVLL